MPPKSNSRDQSHGKSSARASPQRKTSNGRSSSTANGNSTDTSNGDTTPTSSLRKRFKDQLSSLDKMTDEMSIKLKRKVGGKAIARGTEADMLRLCRPTATTK